MVESLGSKLKEKSVIFCAGAGGVGKTTISASLALTLAVHEKKSVLVITVDPAKRLAGALGLSELGNDPIEVDLSGIEGHKGRLYAAMVDMKESWDQIVQSCADSDAQERIFANPIYQNISSQFVQSHDYIAVEVLYDLYGRGDFDLIVVDTPPSRNAIDFLDAPKRMEEFFSSKLLRWLTMPYRSKVFVSAFKPFNAVAEKILGSAFLAELGEFFVDFQSMQDGFLERAGTVSKLINSDQSTFIVVSTASEAPINEASFFITELFERNLPLAGVVINRCLPQNLLDREVASSAQKLDDSQNVMVAELTGRYLKENPDIDGDLGRRLSPIFNRVLSEVNSNYLGLAELYSSEIAYKSKIGVDSAEIIEVAQERGDISSLPNLLKMLDNIW